MVAKNLELLGFERAAIPTLTIVRPAIVDGRMAPHEWLRRPDGPTLKSDAIAHGDDHFFPGPTDIAWDLAGAITEWRLDDAAGAFLVETYARLSGDDVGARLADWVVAYAAFRGAMTTLAYECSPSERERERLAADLARYRETLSRSIRSPGG
jgi:hypothetical protein